MNPQARGLTPEQELAICTRAPYTLVSASAGTGKTLTLVERVIATVHSGIALDRLLVITFTQKAAHELRERLHDALRKDPILRPQRLLLAQSHVSTIDSFCARLLREHALQAGIDPAFRVLSDPYDRLVRDEILDDIFHRWYLGRPEGADGETPDWEGIPVQRSGQHHEFLRLVDLCGTRENREILKLEIERLMQLARVHPEPAEFAARLERNLSADPPPYLDAFAEMLARTWTEMVATYARLARLAREDFSGARVSIIEQFLQTLLDAPAPWNLSTAADLAAALSGGMPAALEALQHHLRDAGKLCDTDWKIRWPTLPNRSKDILGPWNEHARQLLDARGCSPFAWLPADLHEIHGQYRKTSETLRALLALLRQAMIAYDSYKQERGLLDFADLELQARRLLRAAPAELRKRFDMVLVDEFQDINGVQADIIAALEPAHGRFLVGDIKQCIYQFRLSDPSIFLRLFDGAAILHPGTDQRASASDSAPRPTETGLPGLPKPERVRMYLSRNFRSRCPVLATVNSLCAPLLTHAMIGGDYAAEALRFGACRGLDDADQLIDSTPGLNDLPSGQVTKPSGPENAPPAEPPCGARGYSPVEIHLIDQPAHDLELPDERHLALEASLVAGRISALVAQGFPVYDNALSDWRPLRYGDIAVILRSPGPTGTAYARVLRAHGLPVSFGGRDFFERREVRDFMCLLRTLANAHDDVSLAAVMRMPGVGFADADLARIRLAWPRSYYLLAALRATASGETTEWSGPCENRKLLEDSGGRALVARCHRFLPALERWRASVQSGDLPTALVSALDESGLLAAVAAAGGDCLGNLQRLLAQIRRHCAEHGHSLCELIEHLDGVRISGGLESLATGDEGADAVRILSLHQAKGLEFQVVVLSSLGRKINVSDANNKVLTGAEWIGVDIFEPREFVKTPTIARRTLSRLRTRAILDEEIRILYVALTRAREKLIVTGVLPKKWSTILNRCGLWQQDPLPESLLYNARQPLDWVIGALHRAELLDGLTQPGDEVTSKYVRVARHDPAALAAALPPGIGAGDQVAGEPTIDLEVAIAALPGLGERLRERYAHPAAARWRGKFWATEVKRLVDAGIIAEEEEIGSSAIVASPAGGAVAPAANGLALEEGTRLHEILEALDFAALGDVVGGTRASRESAVSAAAHLLAERGRFPIEWITAENISPVVDFLSDPYAAAMQRAGTALEREADFSLRMQPADLARIWPAAAELDEDEWILIQGKIDALWPEGDRLIVLDFKSDRLASAAELRARADSYRPQIEIYRQAAARLWGAGRVECVLYFLRQREAVLVE